MKMNRDRITVDVRFRTLGQAAYFNQYVRWIAGLREIEPQHTHPQFRPLTRERAEDIQQYAWELVDALDVRGHDG
jgi:hypothetical protein